MEAAKPAKSAPQQQPQNIYASLGPAPAPFSAAELAAAQNSYASALYGSQLYGTQAPAGAPPPYQPAIGAQPIPVGQVQPPAPPSVLPMMRPELYPSSQPDGGLPVGYSAPVVVQSQLAQSVQPYGTDIAPEAAGRNQGQATYTYAPYPPLLSHQLAQPSPYEASSYAPIYPTHQPLSSVPAAAQQVHPASASAVTSGGPRTMLTPTTSPPAAQQQTPGHLTVGQMLFIGIRGYITAFDMAVPRRLWTNTGWHPVSMLLSDGVLYAVTNNMIYAYNAVDGVMKWSFSHATVSRTASIAKLGNTLFIGSWGYVLAVNVEIGEVKWVFNLKGTSFKPVNILLSLRQDLLFAASNGEVHACDPQTGLLAWKNELKGFSYQPVTLANHLTRDSSYMLMCGTYGYVVLLNPFNGQTLRHINIAGTGYNPVALISRGELLFTCTNGQSMAFNVSSGEDKRLWKNELPGRGYSDGISVLDFGDRVIIGVNGWVSAVDVATGRELWVVGLDHTGYVHLQHAWNQIIAGCTGTVYYLNPGNGHLYWKDDLKGLGYGYVATVTQQSPVTDWNPNVAPRLQ